MPNLPIRGLGSVGVVTDVDPYNLPINAFTRAKNVRFSDGSVRRGPIMRGVSDISINPVFAYGITSLTGFDTVLVVDDVFDVREFSNGTFTTRKTTSGTASTIPAVTATTLADVQYLNRDDQTPSPAQDLRLTLLISPIGPQGCVLRLLDLLATSCWRWAPWKPT